MSAYKKQLMTEERFNTIKCAVTQNPTNNKAACEYWKISESTIGRIRKCKSFAEYKNMVEKYLLHDKTQVSGPDKVEVKVIVPTVQKQETLFEPEKKEKSNQLNPTDLSGKMNKIINLLETQNELLTKIAAKKRGFFSNIFSSDED